MCNLNSLILEGRLLENAELTETLEGSAICNFFIGVSRTYKGRTGNDVEEVSTFKIGCYGAMARSLAQKLTKDTEVRVVGRLKQHRWTDKDGKKWSEIVVVAEHIEIRKKGGSND